MFGWPHPFARAMGALSAGVASRVVPASRGETGAQLGSCGIGNVSGWPVMQECRVSEGCSPVGQLAVLPPFTRMIWPVMNAALSEATNRIASAISCGVPPRFIGTAA